MLSGVAAQPNLGIFICIGFRILTAVLPALLATLIVNLPIAETPGPVY